MFRSAALEIFKETWPMILICSVILISMRVTWLVKHKQRVVLYQELLMLSFVIYIMCLFYVVTFQDVSWSTSNFIPFKEMFRYRLGSQLFIKNVLGNMIMFLPYGFFVSYFLKLEKLSSVFFLSTLTSVTIEFTQKQIGRVFDIDDIFLNILGALLGFLCYRFFLMIKQHLPETLKKNIIYNILVIALMAVIVLYLGNIIKLGVI